MQNDAKKERNAKKELGYKHEWIDTGGHRHRIFFDTKSLEKPKATWTTLIIVSALTFLIGGVVLLTVPASKNGDAIFFAAVNSTPKFVRSASLTGLTAQTPTAIAAGWGNEFFLADRSGVGLFDVDGQKLDFWKNDSDVAPTALAFVADESSAKNGLLLIAYPKKIDAMYFDVSAPIDDKKENVDAPTDAKKTNGTPEKLNVVRTRSAAKAALGPASTILSFPTAEIAAVATSDDRLFVGDRKAERVWRFSWKTLDSLKDAESKETPPDCELGAPETAGGYPGLRLAAEPYFGVVYVAANQEICVANSGLFRVDAFSAESGSWNAERSWAKGPGFDRSFSGLANPVAVVVSPKGWIATLEAKKGGVSFDDKKSPLQIWDLNGNWLAEIPTFSRSNKEEKERSDAFYFAAALLGDSSTLLALNSNGGVDLFINENR